MNDDSPKVSNDTISSHPATELKSVDPDLAKANLDLVIGWVSHADSKATFYLTVALAMLGASLTEVPALVRVCDHFWSTHTFVISMLIGLHLVFYGSALWSAYKAIEVVKPRLAPDSKTHSWYFFQSVATFEDVEKWREFTNGLHDGDRLQHLVDQIWNVSRVAVKKYRIAGRADFFLRVAICAGIVAVMATLVLAEQIGEPNAEFLQRI